MRVPFFSNLIVVLLTLCFVACGEDEDTSDPARSVEGLLFVGTDNTYSSSVLYGFDTEEQTVSEVLAGQSGDFIIARDRDLVLGFNRKPDQLNFRQIYSGEETFTFGDQTALPAKYGNDPHDFVKIANDIVLAANYSHGSLALINIADGTIITEFLGTTGELDIVEGTPFRPEDIIDTGSGRVAVLHQGFNQDFSGTSTAVIFVFEVSETEIKVVDLDIDKDKTQGLELNSHIPNRFVDMGSGRYIVSGFCPSWAGAECKSATDYFDAAVFKVDPVETDLFKDFSGYSTPVYTGTEQMFYVVTSTTDSTDPTNVTRELIKVDITSGDSESILSLDAGPGFLLKKPDEEVLYIGQGTSETEGKILVIENETLSEEVETPAIPVGAVFTFSDDLVQ